MYIRKDAVKLIENHPWPGNVRELENAIERIVLLYDGMELTPEHLRFLSADPGTKNFDEHDRNEVTLKLPPERYSLVTAEAEVIKKALKMFRGNKTRTASYFGISLSTLKRKITTYRL